MNKSELISRAAAKSGITQKQMRKSLDALLGIIGGELATSGEVVLPDFGKFYIKRLKERSIRPFGGAPIKVPSKEKISFKPYANIRIYSARF